MNNYMRHVDASFLISYLRLSWLVGYRWFQDTLLDADVAINAMMWQNGGMSGKLLAAQRLVVTYMRKF
jgi:deoxyribodipyrimidine photolyase